MAAVAGGSAAISADMKAMVQNAENKANGTKIDDYNRNQPDHGLWPEVMKAAWEGKVKELERLLDQCVVARVRSLVVLLESPALLPSAVLPLADPKGAIKTCRVLSPQGPNMHRRHARRLGGPHGSARGLPL